MKELEILIEELNNCLSAKEFELRKNPNFNSHTSGTLLNRQREIENFEQRSKIVEKNPLHKSQIIENFQKDFGDIKSRIDSI